jgi:hypothetical protein
MFGCLVVLSIPRRSFVKYTPVVTLATHDSVNCPTVCVRLEMTCYSTPSADRKNMLLTVTITFPLHYKTNKCTEFNIIFLYTQLVSIYLNHLRRVTHLQLIGIKTCNGLLNTLKFVNKMPADYYKIRCNGAGLFHEMCSL